MELSENKRRVKFEDYVSEELKKRSDPNARQRTRRKREMDELRNQFGGKCKNCGSKKKLEFAHILPTKLCGRNSRGSGERYFDIKNNPSSYVLLCSICHKRIGETPEMTQYRENLWLKERETLSEEACQIMLADKREWMKWSEEHYGEILKQTEKHVKGELEKKRLELEEFKNFMKSKNYSLPEN